MTGPHALILIAILAAEPSSPAPAADPVGQFEGVYKVRFKNGAVDGSQYQSENILEVVRVGESAAYVRVALAFYNGHQCSFWGIARTEGSALVVDRPAGSKVGGACRVTVGRYGEKVVLSREGPECQSYCGARGALGAEWPASARSSIRYLDLLRNSWEYKEALAEAELTKAGEARIPAPPGSEARTSVAISVICSDQAVRDGFTGALAGQLAQHRDLKLIDHDPQAGHLAQFMLYLFVNQDVNDRKNPGGWSVAVAHVNNLPLQVVAGNLVGSGDEAVKAVKPVLVDLVRNPGVLVHLNVAHVDALSEETVAGRRKGSRWQLRREDRRLQEAVTVGVRGQDGVGADAPCTERRAPKGEGEGDSLCPAGAGGWPWRRPRRNARFSALRERGRDCGQ